MGNLLRGSNSVSPKLAKKQKKQAKADAKAAAEAASSAEKQAQALIEVAQQEAPEIVIPPLPEPERMPSEVDAGTQKARNRIQQRKRGGGGRMSTILTG